MLLHLLIYRDSAGDERYTKILHGNSNTGGTETYFQIEQYDGSGSYVKKIAQYSYQYDYWDFLPAGTRRLRVDTSGIDVTGHTELDDVNVSGVVTATSIDSATLNSVANLNDNQPSNALTIGTSADTVTISGNLVVSGTETIIDVERLEVGDNNIGIASTTPKLNDSNLDGAGITIYGSEGDKTLTWSNSNSRMEFNTALSASSFTTSGAVTAGSLSVSGSYGLSSKYTHQKITSSGSATETLNQSGRTATDIIIFVNGIAFLPTDDYSVSGTTLTFVEVPCKWCRNFCSLLTNLKMKTYKEFKEEWSNKYKKSINCSNPKGFSQKSPHCAARDKRAKGEKTKSKPVE